jgi:hypothetical protein
VISSIAAGPRQQSFLVPSPAGLTTIFHYLTALGVVQIAAQSCLVSGLVGTHEQIFIRSKTVYVVGNESFIFLEDGLVVLSRRQICCIVVSHDCTRTHTASSKSICTLWTPYTLCHFITMNSIYAGFCCRLCVNLFYHSETVVSHLKGRRADSRHL